MLGDAEEMCIRDSISTAVRKTLASASSKNTFQPRAMSWSKRKRGRVQRMMMKKTMKANTLAKNVAMCSRPVYSGVVSGV